MIDNVYELKQLFVGFNKVKLLTVVFYCMTYSWCSFLNEYNATDNHQEEEKKEEEPKEKKGVWAVLDDAVVYKGDKFTVTYTWNKEFWGFVDVERLVLFSENNNVLPAGCERASRLVDFLHRYHDILGITVLDEEKYDGVDDKKLPGCCRCCCKGEVDLERLYLRGKKNRLSERICSIDLSGDISPNDAKKQWYGNDGVIDIKENDLSKHQKKRVLAIIANLFDQGKVDGDVQKKLVLSGAVEGLIRGQGVYRNVSFDDVWSLDGVIVVERQNNPES